MELELYDETWPLIKWSDELVRDHVHNCIDKHYEVTPSAIVLKSNYIAADPRGTGWRFDKMRAFVEQEAQIYKQELKDDFRGNRN